MQHLLRMLAVFVVAGLLLSACGTADTPGQGGAASETAGEPGASQEDPAADGQLDSSAIQVSGEVIGDTALLEAAEEEGVVTFYTSQAAADEQLIVDAFADRFPNIRVEVVRAPGARLYERIVTEHQAGQLEADVMIVSDMALMEDLRQRGVLAEYEPLSIDQYPEESMRAPYWYTAVMPVMYFIYNHEVIAPENAPQSWDDLLDPQWKGQIGMTPAGIGGTAWTLAYFQRKELGEDYWAKLAAQNPSQHTGGAGLSAQVAQGEVPIGITADVTDYRLRVHQGAPITAVFPTEGAPVVLYTIGIAETAPHPNAARLMLNWYLSAEGQARAGAVRGGYSAREDVVAPLGKPSRSSVNLYFGDQDELINLRDQWVEEWNTIFNYR